MQKMEQLGTFAIQIISFVSEDEASSWVLVFPFSFWSLLGGSSSWNFNFSNLCVLLMSVFA